MIFKLDYSDRIAVKKYIVFNLTNNRLNKGNQFFKKLIELYKIYPNLITDILLNLNQFTYFKDYFRILFLSKNEELNNYIYDFLLKTIKKDMSGVNITTLAKWLPRKGSHYDKKLNFVNKFAELMFPNDKKNRLVLFIKYKKTLSKLNKIINPIEIALCEKQHDKIKFPNLTKRNMHTYNRKFQKHDDLNNSMDNYIKNKVSNYDYDQYINRVLLLNNLNDFKKNIYKNELEVLNDYWKNKNLKGLCDVPSIMKNSILLLDVNSGLLNRMKKSIIKILY